MGIVNQVAADLPDKSEGQVIANGSQPGMLSSFDGSDTVEPKPRRPTPNNDVAVFKADPGHRIAASLSSKEERRRQSQRNRDNGLSKIAFVLVLMECQFCSHVVAIHETRIGRKFCEARAFCGGTSQ